MVVIRCGLPSRAKTSTHLTGILPANYARELAVIEKRIAALLDHMVDSASRSVIAAYEKRIAEPERGSSAALSPDRSHVETPTSST